MPLMQLSTLVLPAPFGPMSANSSPGSTAKETLSSTTRPPNCRHRCSTASSAIPPPRPAILLDLPIRAALTARLTEIEFLHVLVALQALAITVEHNAAVFHDIGVVRDRQSNTGALLDEENGNAQFIADRQQLLRQFAHGDGCQPQ